VLAAFLGPASAQPEPPPVEAVLQVQPGEGIGPYRLHLGLSELVARLGRAGAERHVVDMAEATRDCTERSGGRVLRWVWRQQGLWLTADADTGSVRVLAAFGTSGPYRTDRGVRLGDPLERAERLHGPGGHRVVCRLPRGVQAHILRYRELGLQFTVLFGPVPGAGRVFEIGVFRPGRF